MDALYWSPFERTYVILQGQTDEAITQELQQQHDWLLQGVSKFKSPSGSSKQALSGKSVLIQGKKLGVNQRLQDATGKLSALLDLDQFQAHLILKRWAKESGAEASWEGLPPDHQVSLDPNSLAQVIQGYHRERNALLRSIQIVQLEGQTGRKPFEDALSKLVRDGLEDKLTAALRANVERTQALYTRTHATDRTAGAAAGTSGAIAGAASQTTENVVQMWAGTSGNAAVEAMLVAHQMQLEQACLERCELLTSLLLLYQLQKIPCTPMRSVELLRLLSTPLGLAAPSSVAKVQAAASELAAGPSRTQQQPSVTSAETSALLAEFLSCVLLIYSLDIPAHLSLGANGPQSADALPLGGKTKDIHADICAWPGGAASVMLWGTWAALTRFFEPCLDLGEAGAVRLQGAVVQYSVWRSTQRMVDVARSLLSPTLHHLCRSTLLQATSAMAAAFELGPATQCSSDVHDLWDMIGGVIKDDADLCAMVWSSQQQTLRPLRTLLDSAATLFPAVSWPLLQLLAALAQGQQGAAAAHQYLQTQINLVIQHQSSDRGLVSLGGNRVQACMPVPWNLAPSVPTLVLPEGIVGHVVPWPAVLDSSDPRSSALVSWEVVGADQEAGFGYLLLLGRTAHILNLLTATAYEQQPLNADLIQELDMIVTLVATLASQNPACVEGIMTVTLDTSSSSALPGACASFTWLHAACAAVQLLARVAASGLVRDAATARVLLSGLRQVLVLAGCTSQYNPGLLLTALQQMTTSSVQDIELPDYIPLSMLSSAALSGGVLASPPTLHHVALETVTQDYSATEALLQLVDTFLQRGYAHKGPLPALVLSCLLHVLPAHTRWEYKRGEQRWQLSASLMQVLASAICQGSQASPTCPLPTDRSQSSQAASVQLTGLGAVVTQYLLTNGDNLLLDTLPLPLPDSALTSVTVIDTLPSLELASVALLRLLRVLLVAAATASVESPLEERLVLGWGMDSLTPATILAGLVSHGTDTEAGAHGAAVVHEALRFIATLQECVALHQNWLAVSSQSFLPPDSSAHEHIIRLISSQTASLDPTACVLALGVLEACVPSHPGLLHTLLHPAPDAHTGDRVSGGGGDAAAAISVPAITAPGAGKGRAKESGRDKKNTEVLTGLKAIDGLLEQHVTAGDNRSQWEVLAALMQFLCALWQHPGCAHSAVHTLSSNKHVWTTAESCITHAYPADSANHDAASTTHQPALQQAAASALHLLSIQAARAALPSGSAADTQATRAAASDTPLSAVVKNLVTKHTLLQVLKSLSRCADTLADQATRSQALLYTQLLELTQETGALYGGGMSGETVREEARVAFVDQLMQEMTGLAALLQSGQVMPSDIQSAHSRLLSLTSSRQADARMLPSASPGVHAVMSELTRRQGADVLWRAVARPGMTLLADALEQPPHSGSALLFAWIDPVQVTTVLEGGLVRGLTSTEPLTLSASECVRAGESLSAHLTALHATCSLLSLALHDPSLSPTLLPPSKGPGAAAGAGTSAGAGPNTSAAHAAMAAAGSASASFIDASVASLQQLVDLLASRLSVPEGSESASLLGSSWGSLCLAAAMQATHAEAQLLLHALSVAGAARGAARPAGPGVGTPGAASAASAAADRSASQCVSAAQCCGLVEVLTAWLQTASKLPPACSHSTIVKISGVLAGACGLAVQQCSGRPTTGSVQQPQLTDRTAAAAASSDASLRLNSALLSALPLIWDACMDGWLQYGQATQVLVQAAVSLMTPREWLPLVQSRLDLPRLLDAAVSDLSTLQDRQDSSTELESVGLGPLHLALLASQSAEGAAWLLHCGLLPALTQIAHQILHAGPPGEGLSEFSTVSLSLPLHTGPTTKATAATPVAYRPQSTNTNRQAPDTAGAYVCEGSGVGSWSRRHMQWCTLLGLSGSLIRSMGQFVPVEQESIDLLCCAETRLRLAVLPPHATRDQPLTLADLCERERALYLLTQLARYQGTWHLARPSSLTQFRAAAVAFLAFTAVAGSSRPVTLECPPQTTEERTLATQTTGLPRVEGWFRVCALGASDPAALAATTSMSQGGATAPAAPAAPAAPSVTCSEYAARMAESLYTCVRYALIFLQTTAPEVSDGERGAVLGPGWPRSGDLSSLQQQCLLVLGSMGEPPARGPQDPRRIKCCRLMLKILQSLNDMLELVGCSHQRSVLVACLRDQMPLIEKALQSGEGVPLPPGLINLTSMASTNMGFARSSSEAPTLSGQS